MTTAGLVSSVLPPRGHSSCFFLLAYLLQLHLIESFLPVSNDGVNMTARLPACSSPSVADLVHRVADAQDARPLDGVQLSKEGSGLVDVLLRRLAKTIAVKSCRDVTEMATGRDQEAAAAHLLRVCRGSVLLMTPVSGSTVVNTQLRTETHPRTFSRALRAARTEPHRGPTGRTT